MTSTERTTIVSSNMPKATAKPNSARKTTGSVPSTANVPARTTPAEAITPPRPSAATAMPSRQA